MIDLKNFHEKNMTQFGQAGVLRKIFEEIGTTNKYFVEFGSEGTPTGEGNSAFLRINYGFDGLLMDGTPRINSPYKVEHEFICSKNINTLFEKYKVPYEFDFLSIDIDNNDWWVWKCLDNKYKPRVITCECASDFDKDKDIDIVCIELDHMVCPQAGLGSSALAVVNLANYKGYDYVAHCGVDAVFIKNDIPHNFIKNDFDYIYDGPIHQVVNNISFYSSSRDLLKL